MSAYDNLYTGDFINTVRAEFKEIGCAQLYDAAARYCHVLDLGIVPRTPERHVAGPVYPVTTQNDMLPCLQALGAVPAGWVLFIHNEAEQSDALAGDIFLTAMKQQKLGGLIVNGAVRDIDAFAEFGIPVFSRKVTFVSAKTAQVPAAEVPSTVPLGEFALDPGDFVFGDSDGLLVVKGAHLNAVINGARVLNKMEVDLKASLEAGNRLSTVIGLDDFIAGRGPLRFEI